MAQCVYSRRYRGIDGFLADMDWSLKHKTEALKPITQPFSQSNSSNVQTDGKYIQTNTESDRWRHDSAVWCHDSAVRGHDSTGFRPEKQLWRRWKIKMVDVPIHTIPSPEKPVWHTQSLLPGRVLLQTAFAQQPPLFCTQGSWATLKHTHTHTGMHRWEAAAVRVVHLYHQCVLTLAKCSISFKPSSTETSEPGWCDDATVRWHETDVLYKGVIPPPSDRGRCSKSTYFALVWHLTNPHRSSADSISIRQQTHTHTHLKYSGGFTNNL